MTVAFQPSSFGYRAQSVIPKRIAASLITAGDPVTIRSDGKWERAIADSIIHVARGIAIESAAGDGSEFDVAVSGTVGGYAPGTFTGNVVYLSQTITGGLTNTQPTDASKPIFLVGQAESDTSFTIINETLNAGLASSALSAVSWEMEWSRPGAANNQFLNAMTNLTPERIPYVSPFKMKLIGCTYVNEVSNADWDLELYKAPSGGGVNPLYFFFKWEFRGGVRTATRPEATIPSPVIIDPGDKIVAFSRKNIKEPTDPLITLQWQVLGDTTTTETKETFDPHFGFTGVTIISTGLVTITTTIP